MDKLDRNLLIGCIIFIISSFGYCIYVISTNDFVYDCLVDTTPLGAIVKSWKENAVKTCFILATPFCFIFGCKSIT